MYSGLFLRQEATWPGLQGFWLGSADQSLAVLVTLQIFNLKFTAKQLSRAAIKSEKEEKSERLKIKKAIEKGNMEGAKIYAQNAIRKKNESLNYMKVNRQTQGPCFCVALLLWKQTFGRAQPRKHYS
jgi:hypothetical protein